MFRILGKKLVPSQELNKKATKFLIRIRYAYAPVFPSNISCPEYYFPSVHSGSYFASKESCVKDVQ